jgi:hypothetical protein
MADAFRASTELAVGARPTLEELVRLDVVASAALDLPGIKLSVDGVGVGAVLRIDLARNGSLGILDVVPAFRQPTGAGAELDLPGFSGSGFLEKRGGELRGVVAADLNLIRVSGFGILGIDEFSLLVLLAAEFRPGIQLSFGFTLVGVGGIVGINRGVDVDALGAAVSSGDLGRLLFPRDPVAQAPQLLDALARCFPREEGGVVVGPLLKLGWGTPTMLAATLGVIVSTSYGGVVIVGRLAMTLPFEELPIIRLQALVLGTVDASVIALDATLVDSYVAGIPVQGDFRMRLRTDGSGQMAISAGGFHPAFSPPDGMSGMRRLGAEISPGPLIRLRLEAYAAVTTSSLQFGARVEVRAGIDGFGIHGHGSFDALFVTEPTFQFTGALEVSVSVECADFDVGGVDLHGEVTGPSPWSVRGHLRVSLLAWHVNIDIPHITWGGAPSALPPARDPLDALARALGRPESWSAGSAGVPQLAMLRPGVGEDRTALHPLAAFQVRQRTVPLGTELQRMDGRTLPRPTTLSVSGGDVGGVPVREEFVPSQFFALDHDQQLAGAGFTELPAGLDFGTAGHVAGAPHDREVIYDRKVLAHDNRFWKRSRVPFADAFGQNLLQFATPSPKPSPLVQLADAEHVVVTTADLTPEARFEGSTMIEAVRAASADDALQVVAAWEIAS